MLHFNHSRSFTLRSNPSVNWRTERRWTGQRHQLHRPNQGFSTLMRDLRMEGFGTSKRLGPKARYLSTHGAEFEACQYRNGSVVVPRREGRMWMK